MEGRFGDIVLTARYFYVTALVHLTKDFDDLIYSVSFLFHVSGRVFARQSLIFNGPVCGGQVKLTITFAEEMVLNPGDSFEIMSYASQAGAFSAINFINAGAATVNTEISETKITLSVQ